MIKQILLFMSFSLINIYVKTETTSDDILIKQINSIQDLWKAGKQTRTRQQMISTIMKSENEQENERDVFIDGADMGGNFDAREAWPECESIRRINDQSECKSSWAMAAVESMSDRLCINSGGMIKKILSVEDVLSCCPHGELECGEGCNGGNPYKAWQFWQKHGIVTGGEYGNKQGCRSYSIEPCGETINNITYPSCTNTTKTTPICKQQCDQQSNYPIDYKDDKHYGNNDVTQLSKSIMAIQSDIMTAGPIQTTIEIYDDFLQYTTGIYVHLTGQKLGKLSVRMLGWGVDDGVPYWLLANSWGSKWGENGTFRVLRSVNECGIEANCISATPKLA